MQIMLISDRLGQLEESNKNYQKLIEDTRPWWKRLFAAGAIFLVIFMAVSPVMAGGGSVSGNVYLSKMNESDKASYILGVVGGMHFMAVLMSENNFKSFEDMIAKKTALQIKAMVDKYLKEHPEMWHEDMAFIIFSVISENPKP